jgi:hypothetical protein
MISPLQILLTVVLFGLSTLGVRAGDWSVEVESGASAFSRNDISIPGKGGTRFDFLDLGGKGPDAFVRAYLNYRLNERHSFRLTLAPLESVGRGRLDEDVLFDGDTFLSGVETKGTYRFNNYRLGWRYMFDIEGDWHWGIGAVGFVRDAEVSLSQAGTTASYDNVGFVPLLHLYGEGRLTENTQLIFDMDAAGATQGRAIDAAIKVRRHFEHGWYTDLGYRTLEGGADNDDVYTFSWIHYAVFAVGKRL